MIILAFFCFLRFSKLASLIRRNIVFYETYMELSLENSKCVISRSCCCVKIAKFHSELFHVENLSKYLELCSIEGNSEEYIFRAIINYPKNNTQKLQKENNPISNTKIRELILEVFKRIGENPM